MAVERPDWNFGSDGREVVPANGTAPLAGLPDPQTIIREMEAYSGPAVPANSESKSGPLDAATLQAWRADGSAGMFLGIVERVASLSSRSDAVAVEAGFYKLPGEVQRELLVIVRNRRPKAENF